MRDSTDRVPPSIRYRFPPLERRGVIAGWRAGQVTAVAVGLVLAVLSVRSSPTMAGVGLAVIWVGASVALAFWPVAGRTGEQWLPVVARWGWAAATGHRFEPSAGPSAGSVAEVTTAAGTVSSRQVPAAASTAHSVFDGLQLVAGPIDQAGSDLGVLVDQRARTVTAALDVRGHSFALLGPVEQDARVAAWARVLATLAREGSAVHRVQWIESCVPDDGSAVRAHFSTNGLLGADTSATRSYRQLLDESSPVTRRHRVVVAVSIHRRRSARAIRSAGGGLPGALAVLGREVEAVRCALVAAEVGVDQALDRAELSRAMTDMLRPTFGVDSGAGKGLAATATTLVAPWPMGTASKWESVHTDGIWHATYWVAEWPRIDVHPDFLGPLLFAPLRRTLSVVMEPVDTVRASRQVAQARTAGLADGELRRKHGFLTSARHTRERQSVDDRDEELADGHAQFRYSGYVGVSADSEAALAETCATLEQLAGQARLDVRRLYGQQDSALLCLLPTGRGLS